MFRSHLTRGAWIEISEVTASKESVTSHLTRGAWIEIFRLFIFLIYFLSHLTRGAWIEMRFRTYCCVLKVVAPHTRCVD